MGEDSEEQPSQTIDMLTPAELATQLRPIMTKLSGKKPPTAIKTDIVVTPDASGNVGGGDRGSGVLLFTAPTGMRAEIMRVSTWANGLTPQAPLTTGYLTISRGSGGEVPELWFPGVGTTVAPASYEGGEAAPRLRPGGKLFVCGKGLPVAQQISITLYVNLFEGIEMQQGDWS